MRPIRSVWPAIAVIALAIVYVAAATHHADTVNTSRARADQSGYLYLAVIATMGLDVVFVLWPRLSAEFAGY